MHGLALADDALGDLRLHGEQLLALAFQHLVDRDAGPARDDSCDHVGLDHLLRETPAAPLFLLDGLQLRLKLGDDAIGELTGLGEVAAALRLVQLDARGVELFLDLLGAGELLLFFLPALAERVGALFQIHDLLLQPLQAVLGGAVGLLLQRLALDLELHEAPVELVELFGL